jgi:hypothetical protein
VFFCFWLTICFKTNFHLIGPHSFELNVCLRSKYELLMSSSYFGPTCINPMYQLLTSSSSSHNVCFTSKSINYLRLILGLLALTKSMNYLCRPLILAYCLLEENNNWFKLLCDNWNMHISSNINCSNTTSQWVINTLRPWLFWCLNPACIQAGLKKNTYGLFIQVGLRTS